MITKLHTPFCSDLPLVLSEHFLFWPGSDTNGGQRCQATGLASTGAARVHMPVPFLSEILHFKNGMYMHEMLIFNIFPTGAACVHMLPPFSLRDAPTASKMHCLYAWKAQIQHIPHCGCSCPHASPISPPRCCTSRPEIELVATCLSFSLRDVQVLQRCSVYKKSSNSKYSPLGSLVSTGLRLFLRCP